MDRGRAKDRIGTRRQRALVACALALLALPGATGCGESGEDEAAARRRAAVAARHARELAVGRRVFAKHCQACHTLAGKPYDGPIIEFEAPNLDEVRLKRKYVEWRVEYGGPAMA
ncbi:MAG TPA: cytochrome c, partial [Conexibacter sp.]|nr:cytochrome c [Conexibacter sp.]